MDSTNLFNGEDNFKIYTTFETTNLSSMSVGTRTDMQETWFGVYSVTATNSQGSKNLRFTAVAKGKPSPPYGGTAVCPDVDQATLSWTSGFNGGSSQTFIVGIRNDMRSSITIDRSTNQTDPGRGHFVTTTVYGLKAETEHFFTVYAVNEIGNSSFPEEVNCTTKAKPQGSSLGAIFGGLGVATVGLSVLVFVVIFKRKTSENKRKGADEEMISVDQRRSVDEESSDGMKPNILYESAGLKPNVLYECSGPLPGSSSEYAVVEKSSKNKSVSPDDVYAVVDKSKKPETTDDVYAEVVKPKIKKGKEKKKQGNVKQKGGIGKSEGNDVYANCKGGEKKVPEAGLNRQKNQDGLIYLDVEFKGEQEKGMFTVIHGVENRSDYADVDFTKHAEPLPQENEQPTGDVNVK
ncbi:uncharacterized protein LOC110463063 isoform X1 [Mizuhopecten yessoensis]|uniref:uncharacterized protein LOC110463063 isoform X1 n=1 Tax=Mizuhopecten yessoensis TaxID=6573 RepID=UPI000B45ACFD|nr:uncharacterized protein LOC110463063 isoform X1 [Mizuhopecten yessoensis]